MYRITNGIKISSWYTTGHFIIKEDRRQAGTRLIWVKCEAMPVILMDIGHWRCSHCRQITEPLDHKLKTHVH
ncbi:unnamed protein product [Heterobilharzia americana]|nr:unnamed protein product [Heterobilharzia americana]